MNKNVNIDKSNIAEITALSHDGRGIAIVNNKKTFISGALPTEKVTFQITKKRSSYITADAVDIIEPSPERATPPCEHFNICGGCSLQHMHTDTQLRLKQHTLLEQLKHFGHVVPEIIMPPLNTSTTGYRRKARLGVKFVIKKNKLLVGFREKASNYLADLQSCAVLHPRVGTRFPALSQLIAGLSIYQHIPQVEIAIGDTDVAMIFRHMQDLSADDLARLCQFGAAENMHIYLQPNSPAPITKLWPENTEQRLRYTLPDHGLEFLFHPLDFTQINLEMNRSMVAQAITCLELQPTDRVLDLFCGIGNFTLPIARHVAHVTGVEGSDEMVQRAQQNAQHNSITNVAFYATNLLTAADQPWLHQHYDKILLDPPRVGAKEILPIVAKFAAKRIVYVSCNPATLARDAGELVHQYGYTLVQAGIMNMFPHTSHIEAMAVFIKE